MGGFLDAYTFLTRGGVFANAQTGNMVLFGVGLSERNLNKALSYFIPVLSFFIGIIIAEVIKTKYKNQANFHWRQLVVLLECIALVVVAFIPESGNLEANAIISFVCSLQVEAFRRFHGNPYATTMCTGNLRSATENLYHYRNNGDKTALHKSLQYFAIIGIFIFGGGIGAMITKMTGFSAVLCPAAVLVGVILLMTKEEL
ncbi:hypothetical protein lbkm_1479 [Lachnospiraceae bacterium KM106-2]|nr:hypothetical protein lbkm_1479 [Lachnospiraceae bacterium KM106-2]